MLFLKLKRLIASNKYFWKYRHILQPFIFKKKYGIVPIKYFNKVFKQKKINSVLDFGCATGDKLEYFVSKGTKYIYGVDINSKAIHTASNKFLNLSIKQKFSTSLNRFELLEFLKKNKLRKFDLVIVDRVFYIHNDKDFYSVLKILSTIVKYIYIDDFFLNDNSILRKNIKNYKHTNFDLILNKFHFKKIYSSNSPYKKVINANSKSVLYKKIK